MKLSSIETCFNPYGLRALLVDDDPTSLFLLSTMLQTYHYQVTPCERPREALSLIRNDQCKFDIVISGLDLSSDMNGVQLLEIIAGETDLPVVIVSDDDRTNRIIECVKKGACAYLPKPVRKEDIQLLWQHVARKEILNSVENGKPDSSITDEDNELCGSSDGGPVMVDRRGKYCREDEHDNVERKKQRLVWTDELHHQFLDAVEQLGINKAVPKKVLELMNVPWITRENVASHLQKYRLNLKKQSGHPLPHSGTDISIGAYSSVITHNELLRKTQVQSPLLTDHYYMYLGRNPSDRFHEPDQSL